MSRLLERLYEKLWRRVGGKPWTEIIREDSRRSLLLYLLAFLWLGVLVARVGGKYWWQILLGFLLGVVCGHLWW